MTAVVAVILALLSTGLKPIHDKNEAVYNKKSILLAVSSDMTKDPLSLADDEVQEVFANQVEQKVFDMSGNELDVAAVEAIGYKGGMAENVDLAKESKKAESERILPLYIFQTDGGEKRFILSVRGKGLWDDIWGNVALSGDGNEITGISFDHKGETPGLGAEIKDNAAFPAQFIGKNIYDANGMYKSVDVIKGGVSDPNHQVDAISGATITCVGVGEMMKRSIKYYEPILKKVK